ncbi:MAG TPA: type II toxin-antitoxin system HicA family toxin [Thermoanaerobaculia bacterium]|nr:type II toxin-antitoxin system HicA family toxin [Thermoanaerobaculia bacterium]
MKTLTGAELARIVEARGWQLRRIQGSHHIYAREGSDVRLSIPIHGRKTLKPGLQRHLLKMAGIDPRELE